jgi:hypothetical protein
VLVGVIAGVAASIPCALLLLAVTRRRQTAASDPYAAVSGPYRDSAHNRAAYERPSAPPVIVVTPGGTVPQQIAPWSTASGLVNGTVFDPYGNAQPRGQRQFRVMGYEEADSQADWEG